MIFLGNCHEFEEAPHHLNELVWGEGLKISLGEDVQEVVAEIEEADADPAWSEPIPAQH